MEASRQETESQMKAEASLGARPLMIPFFFLVTCRVPGLEQLLTKFLPNVWLQTPCKRHPSSTHSIRHPNAHMHEMELILAQTKGLMK